MLATGAQHVRAPITQMLASSHRQKAAKLLSELFAALQRSFQLERLGYFCVDPDSTPGHLVLNRTCLLKDSFAAERKAPAKGR